MKYGFCRHRDCTEYATTPRFTAPLRDIDRTGKFQPEWFCAKHAPRHGVQPQTGGAVIPESKSYEIKEGKLIVLPASDQYEKVHAKR